MSDATPIPRLIRPSALAELLATSEQTLAHGRAGRGRLAHLPFYRVGRSVFYRADEVARWIEEHRVVRASATASGAVEGERSEATQQ